MKKKLMKRLSLQNSLQLQYPSAILNQTFPLFFQSAINHNNLLFYSHSHSISTPIINGKDCCPSKSSPYQVKSPCGISIALSTTIQLLRRSRFHFHVPICRSCIFFNLASESWNVRIS